MTGKIVVATDGSENGGRAVERAAELAKKLDRDLSIVHVMLHGRPAHEFKKLAEIEHLVEAAKIPTVFMRGTALGLGRSPEEEIEESRLVGALADEIVAQAKMNAEDAGAHNVTTRVCAGDYADEILEVAENEHADMIVVGHRGLGRVRETLLGSVSQKILHHAPCTVVVVR